MCSKSICKAFFRIRITTLSIKMFSVILGVMMILAWPVNVWSQEYESYFNYINTMPDEAETNYSEEAQGITHDRDNWFISQKMGLWKIPVGLNLAGSIRCGVSRVICKHLRDVNALNGFNHIGDIDHYQYNSPTGFLLLPLEAEGGSSVRESIAVFDPSNLEYIAHEELPQHKSISWVAVHPDGHVYTSTYDAQGKALALVYKYSLDWKKLSQTRVLSLQKIGDFKLLDESGALLPLIPQGGVFSESGNLLYLNHGGYEEYDSRKDGISVFDMRTENLGFVRRIAHSKRDNKQPFWYGYNPGADAEESEGLTIWDLDKDDRSPHSGQLHVLLLDNDGTWQDVISWFLPDIFVFWPDDIDNIYIRHYSNAIHVDSGYIGEERGKPSKPFNTIGEAYTMAWDGAQINMKTGYYPETLVFSKRIKLVAENGTVVIGQ